MHFLVLASLVAFAAAQDLTTNTSLNASLSPSDPSTNFTALPNATLNTALVNSTVNDPLAGASVPPPAGACPQKCVRKEWRSMDEPARQAYLNAVKVLMNTPAGGQLQGNAGAGSRLMRRQQQQQLNGPSEYDRLVKIHLDAQNYAHGSGVFLPFHRAYIREFELALQRVDPSICLPYWAWTIDSQSPEQSVLFEPAYFGGNGQASDGCVTDGAFAGHQGYYPNPHCLQRVYIDGDQMGTFYSIEAVNRAVATVNDYPTFSQHLEGVLHPTPHQNIGGDMNTMGSSNDPIFFLHHAYIDYIWTGWQKRNGFAYDGDVNAPFQVLTAYKAADVLDNRLLCYDYADMQDQDTGDATVVPSRPPPRATAPPPTKDHMPNYTQLVPLPQENDAARYSSKDRGNLVSIRYVPPVNEDWCKRNNIPVDRVRNAEAGYQTMILKLNQVQGYVSPCSLLKRPTLCVGLVKAKKVQQFYVDMDNVGRVQVGYQDSVAATNPSQAIANVNESVYTCAPDVEAPPDTYKATVQSLTGPSAFQGAGSLQRLITDSDQLSGEAMKVGSVVMSLAIALAASSFVSV